MKLRLQMLVAIGFTLLLTLVLGAATWTYFVNNRALAIATAQKAMADAQAQTDLALIGVIEPVLRVIGATAALVAAFPDTALSRRALDIVEAQIGGLEQITSAYVGYEERGDFLQIARLGPEDAIFGDAKTPVPPGASHVLRMIRERGGERTQQLVFRSPGNDELQNTMVPGTFEPKVRPWYALAAESAGPVFSPVYIFAGTGRPGLTLSRRILSADDTLLGVAGADMTIDAMTNTLARIRVDGVGEIFLADANGTLITSSERSGGVDASPLTDAVLAARPSTGEGFFRFTMPGTSDRYLVSMGQASKMLNLLPVLGVIVPERHFTGAIIDTTLKVLRLSAVLGLLAVLSTVVLARLLSKSLFDVTEEARRISRFDLSSDFRLSSQIAEVADLGAAVANMKNSLTSFGAFVPREVVRSIVSKGGRVDVGGVEREVTLMFSDIESFTAKSEKLSPEIVMRDLSRYFQTMEEAVGRCGGTVDKYIGDAVMALWNAPNDDPDHAKNACRAALACRAAERQLVAAGAGDSIFPARTRFGLHCGRVVVGNVGSPNRLQYTALGGTVNLGSRVEGLNKVYGTDILATQAVVDRVGDRFLFRPVDLVAPAGTTRPVALYELVGAIAGDSQNAVTAAQRGEVAAWMDALTLYRARDFRAAGAAFAALHAAGSPPGLTRLYIDRCARFLADPLPPEWDGVQVEREK